MDFLDFLNFSDVNLNYVDVIVDSEDSRKVGMIEVAAGELVSFKQIEMPYRKPPTEYVHLMEELGSRIMPDGHGDDRDWRVVDFEVMYLEGKYWIVEYLYNGEVWREELGVPNSRKLGMRIDVEEYIRSMDDFGPKYLVRRAKKGDVINTIFGKMTVE